MSPPLARVSVWIASTLFALVALVLLGFVTSPGGVSTIEAQASQTISHDGAPLADDVAHASTDQDDSHTSDAVTPPIWRAAPYPRGSFATAQATVGLTSNLHGPDRPPPRARSVARSGPLERL